MKKLIVIYNTGTGFTEEYAEEIAKRFNAQAVAVRNLVENINSYDLIIYGGSVKAGKIIGLDSLKRNLGEDTKKKLVVFAVGATSPSNTETIDNIWKNNFNEDELKSTPHFYFPGGLRYERMSFFERLIMKMIGRMMKKKEGNQEDGKDGLNQSVSFDKSFDISSPEYVEPLIDTVKEKLNR